MTMKTEGRTQLVGYAMQNRLVASITEARKMELGKLRDIVGLHRMAIRNQNRRDGIDDASIAAALKRELEVETSMIPVPIVHDVDRAFPTTSALKGSIPGWDQIPEEFGTIKSFGKTRWNRLFGACFGMDPGMNWKRFGLLPNKEKGVVAADAWRAANPRDR